jgi:serine/threonine protein kinase
MQTTVLRSSTDTLAVGSTLNANTYVIQSVLGRGAFGITYLAIDQHLDRQVAIKEYLPMGFAKRDQDSTVTPLTGEHGDLFQYGLEGFLKEAKTTVKFNHPNIVRVLAFFEEHQTAYLVMQYEVGENLSSYLKKNKDLSEKRLLEIFCPVNDGLINVHKHGYIHRDIKPDNIYIREDNSPVLLDFGAARDIFNARVDQFTRILTKGYAPYEQDNPAWANQGAWTDIYALGATLFYALTRQRVVSAQERASAFMRNEVDPYQSLVSILSHKYNTHFLQAVDHALAFHPDQRPQSIADWNQALLGNQRSDDEKTQIILSLKESPKLDDATVVYPTSNQPKSEQKVAQANNIKKNKNKQVNQANLINEKNNKGWLAPLFFVSITIISIAVIYWLIAANKLNTNQIIASFGFSEEKHNTIQQPLLDNNSEQDSLAMLESVEQANDLDHQEASILGDNDKEDKLEVDSNQSENSELIIDEVVTNPDESVVEKEQLRVDPNEVKLSNTENDRNEASLNLEKTENESLAVENIQQSDPESIVKDEITIAQMDEKIKKDDNKVITDDSNQSEQVSSINQELLQRTVDAALNHAKTAARSYLRAEMNAELIKDYESLDGMSNRTKYIASLKVQRDDFLVGFNQQFELYLEEVKKLRDYEKNDIELALETIINEKYQSSRTYFALGDLLIKHVSKKNIANKKWQADLKKLSQQSGVFKQ